MNFDVSSRNQRSSLLTAAALLGLCAAPLHAQQADDVESPPGPIAGALAEVGEDVRVYNDHVVTLASPFMEGRVPGSRGMEIAKEYCEHYLIGAGLQPAFKTESGELSFRQPFELRGTLEVKAQRLAIGADELKPDEDFKVTWMGGSGEVQGKVVLCGYGISNGPDGYENFPDGTDIKGAIAVVFRFEPMNEEGKSLWVREGRRSNWSGRAGFARKIREVAKHEPAAILILNPPGADDERINQELTGVSGGSRSYADVPVFHLSLAAGERLAKAAGTDLMALRRKADQGGGPEPLDVRVHVRGEIERKPLVAENVAALLPGRGARQDELIVIGAHLDHLGMGYFGSRSGPGELHPGADDNASGSAAILMLADKLAADYARMPEDASLRPILFMLFSAEESGLNGSRYYVDNPIVPIEKHALMINFDMIGRITNKRLSVSGTQTAEGMEEWLAPLFEESPLAIVQPANMSGASDHSSFLRKEVPVLFGIIADFHGDYHTPRDTSDKINRVDAVATVDLFHKVLMAASTRDEDFVFKAPPRPQRRNNNRGNDAEAEPEAEAEPAAPSGSANAGRVAGISVRFGIAPGNYDEDATGVLVGSVTPDSSAEVAGVQPNDVLKKWNGKEIGDVRAWMGMLAEHKPDDKVQVTVLRDGKEVVLWVTLQGRPDSGGQ